MNNALERTGAREDTPLMPTSTTERLKGEKERLEQRLEAVNEAIGALEANPEIQNAIDAISKLGHF